MKNNENNIFIDTNCLIGFLCDKHNLRKKEDGVTWDTCPEVIHIEQILGNFDNYKHER